ncbi:nitrite reductase [Mycobacterium sp. 1245111.1]|uniref:nitrite reductase n=1 Tax=Mycobacterium sp. 1245111.1 TaxID=1834073 RepID=UPI0007FB7942|nr:nitrite reductase [Mycobacterium sp. 1245111.1]OBK41710.1 nitrite reductase [Mycobacterium sp. 1245111.1]
MTTDARSRADMCPGVWRPWQADDGLLVRIRLMGGLLPTTALRRLSEVSQAYADGGIYLTRRANLQLRGLPGDGAQLAHDVVTAIESTGLIPTRTHELVRNVLASPQTGLAGGRADLRPTITRLDTLLCTEHRLGQLPGRFLFTLDDGRGDLLDRLTGAGKRGTDLGCVALGDDAVQLRVGGHWGAVTSLHKVADQLAELAAQFVDARGTGDDAPWHIRELARPLQPPVTADPRIPAAAPPLAYGHVPGGTHVPADYGVLTPDLVGSLLETAAGVHHVVVTPWRGVLVPNAPEASE